MAQLVERLLPIPEVRGSNPVIGKNLYRTFTVNCIEKTKINKKRPGMAHFKKKKFNIPLITVCYKYYKFNFDLHPISTSVMFLKPVNKTVR